MKPLPPPRRIKVKQLLVKREQDWDNRFVMGKLSSYDSEKKFVLKKVIKKTASEARIDPPFDFNDDAKIGELMVDMIQEWDVCGVPEFHRQYYYEMLQFVNKVEAFERLLKEVNDLKRMMKITKGREKCLMMLKTVVRDAHATLSDSNVMEVVRRISELISHLRILTLNLTEQFLLWRQGNEYAQYRYQEWIYRDWNYLLKISQDCKFLTELSVLEQFLQFSECEDPFFLSLVKQSYESNTEFNDYLQPHKMPRSIVRRIRKCEVIILEEQYQHALQYKNYQDLGLLEKQHVRVSGGGASHAPTPKVVPSTPTLQSPQHAPRRTLFKQDDAELYVQAVKWDELVGLVGDFKADSTYTRSFNLSGVAQTALYAQESCLLFVRRGSINVGLLLCSLDSNCVTSRRWIIHFVLGRTPDLLLLALTLFQAYLTHLNDPAQELQIQMYHFDQQDGKFGECGEFKTHLKSLGYKWKQQVNDNAVRYTLYQLKRVAVQQQYLREPIVCQVGRLSTRTVHTNNLTYEDIIVGYYASQAGLPLDPVQQALANLLQRIKFTAVRFTPTQAPTEEFLSGVQHAFDLQVDATTPAQIQLVNLCLRWQAFTVESVAAKKYIRLPSLPSAFDEGETIVQLRSANKSDPRLLFLVQTMDEDILFFIHALQGVHVTDLDATIESVFETYDQKLKYEGDLWIPAFNSTNQLKSMRGVTCPPHSTFIGESFFSIDYTEGLKCIRTQPNAHSHLFEAPFLAGFIKKDLYEKISKPLYAALITPTDTITLPSPSTLKRPSTQSGLQLAIVDCAPHDVPKMLTQMVTQAGAPYKKTFEAHPDMLSSGLLREQEASILYVYENLKVIGGVTVYIDKSCVTARRWQVQTMMLMREQSFEAVIAQLVTFLYDKDASADEIYIYLRHYPSDEDPERLVSNKSFSESLKKAGFKWKQQTNDPATGIRMITFQNRRPSKKIEARSAEPLQLKSCYILQSSAGGVQKNQVSHKLLQIPNADIKLCDMAFHTHFTNKLQGVDEEDAKLLEKVAKAAKLPSLIPATKQNVFKTQEECEEFFLQDGSKLMNLEVAKFNIEFDCQLTNIQLRWVQAREVLYKTKKHIEFPKNENELVLRGKNEFFANPIYLVSTIDPKFTVFFVECASQADMEDKRQNLSFYTQAIAQFTDSKEIVSQDLVVPQHTFRVVTDHYSVVLSVEMPHLIQNCIERDIDRQAIILHGPIIMGIIQEEIVAKFEMPLISVIYNQI